VLLSHCLSRWLSWCCCPSSQVVVVATAAANTAEPPTRSVWRHCRGHLHCRCRRNRIRCSYVLSVLAASDPLLDFGEKGGRKVI
jgi:hypothetical protein